MLTLVAFSSIYSWLSTTKWIVPLTAIITAIGAVGTVVVAVYIGVQASHVSTGQKEIAGLSEVNKLMAKYDSPHFTRIKRLAAISYLIGRTDELCMSEILDWIEELSMYFTRDFISLAVVEELLSFGVVCWWYACLPVVGIERSAMEDPGIWLGAEELVEALHVDSRKNDVMAWSERPDDKMMERYFLDVLRRQNEMKKADLLDY